MATKSIYLLLAALLLPAASGETAHYAWLAGKAGDYLQQKWAPDARPPPTGPHPATFIPPRSTHALARTFNLRFLSDPASAPPAGTPRISGSPVLQNGTR